MDNLGTSNIEELAPWRPRILASTRTLRFAPSHDGLGHRDARTLVTKRRYARSRSN
jgi:hypothetical protein